MIVAHWLRTLVRRNSGFQAASAPALPAQLRRRRHRRLTVAAFVEPLEDRTVLAAVIPGFDDHGVVINNASVGGQSTVTVGSSFNSQLSNNAEGSGLYIDLDNQGGTLSALKNIAITNVVIDNNGNAGAQIRLANLNLDTLIIDRAKITNSGGAGLYIALTNVTIGQLFIYDSTNPAVVVDPTTGAVTNGANSGASLYQDNAFDGVSLLGNNSTITSFRLSGNVIKENVGHGAFFGLEGVTVTNFEISDNEATANTSGSGVHFETNRTNVAAGTVRVVYNTFSGNSSHGLSFLSQSQNGGTPAASPSRFVFDDFFNNTFANNQGSGVSVDLRVQAAWNATLLRNTFTGNQFRGFDMKAADAGTVTVSPTDGSFVPQTNAFDVQFGDLTVNPQQTLVNANRFDQNRGAGIALELNDTTDISGFTTGKFRILGNTITGTTADTDTNNDTYNGHAIVLVASGSVALQNGSAIYTDSTIDRNTLTGNAGDGVRMRISEDSEVNGLTIGNSDAVNQTFDVNGAFAGGGNVISRTGNGNLIDNNGGNGISILRLSSSIVQNVRILDNRITRNNEGLYLQASNTYETVPEAARPLLKVVNTFTVNNNNLSNNRLNGVHLRTEFNAVLSADMRYNRVDANGVNGVRVTGVENSPPDFQNVGGVWVKNAITNNVQNGIEIQTVVGSVNPLVIGRDGRDGIDNQSLGNFIYRNGVDGIEVGSRPGIGGTETPRDVRDAMDIINNQIIENGRAAVGTPYTAGKGIDIEVLISSPREFRIDRNVIQGNAGDGIELRNAGGMLRVTAEGNFIDLNGGRGVDLLNQIGAVNYNAEAFIHFGDVGTTLAGGVAVSNRNSITNNGLEGFYVVNTAAPTQTQDVNNENVAFATTSDVDILGFVTVNLVLDIENNVIRDNGNGVPGLNNSPPSTLSGTGLVLNIGTQVSSSSFSTAPDLQGNATYYSDDQFAFFTSAAAGGVGSNRIQGPGTVSIGIGDSGGISSSGNGRVNARVVGNEFSGNGGDDVFAQSFVSLIPHSTAGPWTQTEFRVDHYDRDPLARLNMVFTGNTVDSLDVTRGNFSQDATNAGAHLNNAEADWKSRNGKTAPNPSGPFLSGTRTRVGQRVAILGYTFPNNVPAGHPPFYYDGLGPTTFRVEGSWRGTNTLRANQLGDTFDDTFAESEPGTEFVSGADGTGYEWDDVAAGTFSFLTASINNVTVTEASGVATLTVTLSEAAPVGGLTIFYRTSDGSAKFDPNNDGTTSDRDYTQVQSSITFAAGETQKTISIPINSDSIVDPGEQFYVDLFQINSGGDFVDSRGVVTVQEPVLASISTPAPGAEGDPTDPNNGVRQLAFTVTLSAESEAPVSVNYVVNPGTATAGSDYNGTISPLSGTLTFAPGTTSQTITIAIVGDAALESTENFTVVLSSPVGATITTGTATGTILDNDTPTISINDPTVTETAGGSTITFTVSLNKPASAGFPVSVNYGVGGTATAGTDFGAGAPASTVTFAAGESSKTITFNVINDTIIEGAETIVVTLASPTNATILDGTGVGTIFDDDAPTVNVADVTVVEGDNGSRTALFTVTLSKPATTGFPVTINYATSNGTATSGTDFQAKSGTLTFAPGDPVTKTIAVTLVGDLLPEATEQFNLTLSAATNASIVDGQAVATITDDDTPTITVDDAGALESDGFVAITVRLSKAVGVPVTVAYTIAGGTATSGTDYDGSFSPLSGTLTFTPGATTRTINVRLASGDGAERVETFLVTLSSPTGATIADGSATIRIVDDTGAVGLVTTPDAGTEPRVFVYDARGNPRINPSFFAYQPNFTNGVRVATGDVDGDGVTDIVVAPVSGAQPIRVFRSDTYAEIANFYPYSTGYTGGVSIATGDVNGDGKAEIFAATTSQRAADGGSAVRVFSVVGRAGVLRSSFYAFAPAFSGGVYVAAGDVTGDGIAEAVVTPITGAGPAVRVLDALTGGYINSFYAFSAAFSGGVNIAVGDVDGLSDGKAEIIVSIRSGDQPAVRVFDAMTTTGIPRTSFLAFAPHFLGGVNVGVGDVNFDGKADIIAAPASGSTAAVRFFNASTGALLKSTVPPYANTFTNGIFVAGQLVSVPTAGQSLRLAGAASGPAAATAAAQADVQAVAQTAVSRLTSAGGAAVAAKLATVQIAVGDLPGNTLGLARAGSIVIDLNAAGQGWFVDQTPAFDEEFSRGADGVYRAVAPQAVGKVDLLTVITHELAHLLGFDDEDSAAGADSVLAGSLTPGVRRATKQHIDDLFSGDELFGALLTA